MHARPEGTSALNTRPKKISIEFAETAPHTIPACAGIRSSTCSERLLPGGSFQFEVKLHCLFRVTRRATRRSLEGRNTRRRYVTMRRIPGPRSNGVVTIRRTIARFVRSVQPLPREATLTILSRNFREPRTTDTPSDKRRPVSVNPDRRLLPTTTRTHCTNSCIYSRHSRGDTHAVYTLGHRDGHAQTARDEHARDV